LTSNKTSAYIGSPVSFTATSSDPNSDSIRYVFTWGDGTKTMTESLASGTAATRTHVWSSAGTKSVTVNATDSRGGSSAQSTAISVTITVAPTNSAPATPTLSSATSSGTVETIYTFTASTQDPEGDQVKYTFDWGDGQTSTTGLVDSGTSQSASHAWAGEKTYNVKVNAIDSKGASSAWSGSKAVAITVPSLVPGKATLISPTGSISTHTPTFEWNPVTGSTSYTLMIKNGFNTNILQNTYSAQETASGTIRRVTPPQDLAPGQYTWNIKTYNEKRSSGTLSSSTSFTVL